MLILKTHTNKYQYELSNIAKLFFDAHEWMSLEQTLELDGPTVELDLSNVESLFTVKIKAYEGSIPTYETQFDLICDEADELSKRHFKRSVLKYFFEALQSLSRKDIPWGILTGVRPVKLVHEMMDQGQSTESIQNILETELKIRPDKTELVLSVANTERALIFPVDPKSYSVYVGIPFCPSRCHYCSFPSHGSGDKQLMASYLNALIEEIDGVLNHVDPSQVDSLYIGGGTPSVLSAEQVTHLLDAIGRKIPISKFKEITFEAGRPETITPELLTVLKHYDIERICLNPQTFKNETLQAVGRTHQAEDILRVYDMLRDYGFSMINMDLIAGLPNESFEDWQATLQQVLLLKPENITVHTLAIKSGAEFKKTGYVSPEDLVTRMVDAARESLMKQGYQPYYLYRQKYIAGNLENVGYALKGTESRYNMHIMEERQSILAFGVGAVSKMIEGNDRFERVANPRDIKLYIETIKEVIRKKQLFLI